MIKHVIEKSVNGKFPIGKVYKEPDLDTSETISSVACSITPTGDADDLATVGSANIATDGKSFSWVVEKGLASTEYEVQFKVTTSGGKIFEHPIREMILVKIVS